METKKPDPFYHSRGWKRARAAALMRDNGMCRDCMARMHVGMMAHPRRAVMVHHLQPIELRPDLALELDNLISLCDACHNARHPEKGGKKQETAAEKTGMRIIKI